jgi:hypothetical protein
MAFLRIAKAHSPNDATTPIFPAEAPANLLPLLATFPMARYAGTDGVVDTRHTQQQRRASLQAHLRALVIRMAMENPT